MFKVGIYLRLSREDNKNGESESISTQRDLLLNYIKDNDLQYVDEYVDDGVSGTSFDRLGFNRLIKDCESKRINMVITKDTSRLGRDHIEFGYYVEKYFPEHNIRYVAVNDGIDTFVNNLNNDMLLFKSAFNDLYVKDISNKIKSSLITKKRSGKFIGAYAPYGYKKDINDKHKLVIKEEEAKVVRRIFNLFINGLSINKICELLSSENISTPSMSKNMNIGINNLHYGIWSNKTVSDILKNQNYIGNLVQGKQKKVSYKSKKRVHTKQNDWIISKDAIPRIIDEETFYLAQSLFKVNKCKRNNDLLLKGLVYCNECNHMIGFRVQESNTKKYGLVKRIYGSCNYWSKRKALNVCSPHNIKYDLLEGIVIKSLKELLSNIDYDYIVNILNQKLYKNNNFEVQRLNVKKKELIKKIDDCYYDKLNGLISNDMYLRIVNNFKESIKEYDSKLLSLCNKKDIDIYSLIKSKLVVNSSLLSLLIKKITLTESGAINIYLNFCSS